MLLVLCLIELFIGLALSVLSIIEFIKFDFQLNAYDGVNFEYRYLSNQLYVMEACNL